MKFRTLALGSFAAVTLAATALPASAYVACNSRGDCWHVSGDRYNYHRSWGIRVHDDSWKWRGSHYRWREHEGRGYWGRKGVWVTF